MSSGQTKRVNLTLHLNPGDSLADLRTVRQLQQWYDSLKPADGKRDDATMEIRRFHRNNYLAGLQLQLLSPKLCQHIAESMGREALTLAELVGELIRCELLPEGTPTGTPARDEFSKQQLAQLEQMLRTTLPELIPEPSVAPAHSSESAADCAGEKEELSRLRAEIERMNTLLEQQNLQLSQLRLSDKVAPAVESTRNNQAEETDLSEISAATEKMKKIRQKGIF